MILSDTDIRACLKEGLIKINPLKNNQISAASVDLTLSGEWSFFRKNLLGKQVDLDRTRFHSATETVHADYAILNPGEMLLAKTLEKITLPPNMLGKLEGRSRYARMGLSVHITSAIVQPGSRNSQVVLEILNSAPFTIVLKKGMRVSQIVFHEMKSPTSRPYAKFGKIARRQ